MILMLLMVLLLVDKICEYKWIDRFKVLLPLTMIVMGLNIYFLEYLFFMSPATIASVVLITLYFISNFSWPHTEKFDKQALSYLTIAAIPFYYIKLFFVFVMGHENENKKTHRTLIYSGCTLLSFLVFYNPDQSWIKILLIALLSKWLILSFFSDIKNELTLYLVCIIGLQEAGIISEVALSVLGLITVLAYNLREYFKINKDFREKLKLEKFEHNVRYFFGAY